MKINHTAIKVIKADITTLSVDAIVNAANNKLLMGGGVAGVIKRKGGESIESESVKKGPIKIGESIWTKAGQLPSKYVIHAATMGMDFKTDQEKVRRSTQSALACAQQLKIASVALPALGCGTGGFPFEHAAKIMVQEVYKHCAQETSLQEIIFCLYDDEALKVFEAIIPMHLKHMEAKSTKRVPYVTADVIIEIENGIVVIERLNPPFGFALPGGFLDYGETLEQTAIRETKEETDLDLKDLRQFHTYSDPTRDPRFQTVSTVFIAKSLGKPRAGDDAATLRIVPFDQLLNLDYAFDHKEIIKQYLQSRQG